VSLTYYVYYRIRSGREAAARQAVERLLERVASCAGVTGRLLHKRGEPDLWMEVYEGVEDTTRFEGALEQAGQDARMGEVLVPGTMRKVECFSD
jgi:hypothetical protein